MGQMGSAPFASTRRRRRDGGAFSPLALYANGEAGGWYDPSDLTPEKVSWRRNLLTYSQEFDNAAWLKLNATVTGNTAVAPDGTTTADRLVETTATGEHALLQGVTVTAGVTYTGTVHLKAAERNVVFVALDYNGFPVNNGAYFNLSNGTVALQRANTTARITPHPSGNGWYICSITVTASTSTATGGLYIASTDGTTASTGVPSYTGDITKGFLLWGAQEEAAPTATAYQRITDFTSDFLAAFPQHALYQDSAGTTPVMALGQPVGLVLDKSKGGLANLGSELVTNGTFDTNVTGWTAQSGDTLAWDAGNGGRLKITDTNSAGAGIAYQTINTVAGVGYFVQYASSLGNAQQTRIYVGTSVGNSSMGVAVNNADTTFGTLFFTASGTTAVLQFVCQSTGAFAYLDNISVRAVPGAHAIQATSASRPTCDARVNRLTYSEQFDNAFWSDKNNVTITANAAVAPDGTTTADKLIPNTTNGYHNLGSSFIGDVATTVRISLYAKAAGLNLIRISGGNPGTNFVQADLSTGAFTSANVTDASVTSVGNGWWLLSCVLPATGGSNGFFYAVCPNQTNGTYTLWAGNGTDGVFIWGADSRFSSDASLPYQRVVTASDYADVQAPRYLTCDGVDDSLYTAASVDFATWTSGTRRNLLTYPSAFDNAAWNLFNATVTANTTVAPDGTTTADTVTTNTNPASNGIWQSVTVTASTQYTFSFYARRGTATDLKYSVYNNTGGADIVAATSYYSSTSSTDWSRITLTFTTPVGCTSIRVYPVRDAGSLGTMFIWGAQLELGSTATAFQDVGTDKMTVVTGVRKLSDAASTTLLELSATAGSNNGSFAIYAPGSTASPDFYWRSRGTATSNAASNAFAAPVTAVLTALGSISEDIAVLRGNGVQVASSVTDQGAGTYGTYVFFIGRQNNTSFPYNGRIYQLIVRGAQTDTATVQQTERFVAGKTGLVI